MTRGSGKKRRTSTQITLGPAIGSQDHKQKGNGSSANAQTEQKRNKKSLNNVAAVHKGKTRMDIAQQALLTIGVCLGVLATLFGILGFAGHRLWALWATSFAIFAFGFSFTCSMHKWLVSLDSPPTVPSTQPNITERKSSATQPAPIAVVPDVSSDKQHDAKNAAPVQDARLPHENPTPEYIEKILKQVPWESRKSIAEQFIDEPVTWVGRIVSIYPEGDNPTITLKRELDANDTSWGLFSIRVKLPQNKHLLRLPKGSRLEIHGTIASINSEIPELDDVTWKLPPLAATGN